MKRILSILFLLIANISVYARPIPVMAGYQISKFLKYSWGWGSTATCNSPVTNKQNMYNYLAQYSLDIDNTVIPPVSDTTDYQIILSQYGKFWNGDTVFYQINDPNLSNVTNNLFDEQGADPLNNVNTPQPITQFTLPEGSLAYPPVAILDLGGTYEITHEYVYKYYPIATTSLTPVQGGFFYSPVDSSIYYSNGFNWTKVGSGLSASDLHDSLAANALDVLFPLTLNATNKTLSADTTQKDSSLVNYRQMKQYVGTNAYTIKNINVATVGTVQLLSVPAGSTAFILTRIEIIQTSTTGTNPTLSIGYTSPGYSDFFSGTFGMAGQYNTAIPTLSGNLGIPAGNTLYLNITTAGTGTIAVLIEGFYL